MYLCFEEAFVKNFYKILIKIDILSTYFRLTNVSNVNITSNHFINVLINAILICANVLTIYLNNLIIIYLDYE